MDESFDAKEMSADERRQQLLAKANERRASTRKAFARSAVSVWDNLDAVLGLLEKTFLIVVAELVRQHDWVSAGLVCALAAVAWVLKIRRPNPGPLISFFRKDAAEIRYALVSATKTIIHKG